VKQALKKNEVTTNKALHAFCPFAALEAAVSAWVSNTTFCRLSFLKLASLKQGEL
jgi:hypothetical protein